MASSAGKPNGDGPSRHRAREDGEDDSSDNGSRISEHSSSLSDAKRAISSPKCSRTASATASPKVSREGSPTCAPLKPGTTSTTRTPSRSRKNSTDMSPNRASSAAGSSIPTIPSAAAIQRALAASGTPYLPSSGTNQDSVGASRPQKPTTGASSAGGSGLKGVSRLSSPPPSSSLGSNKLILGSSRKADQSQSPHQTPSIVVDRPERAPASMIETNEASDDDRLAKSGMRAPARVIGANGPPLETVQEGSLPTSSTTNTDAKVSQGGRPTANDRLERVDKSLTEDAAESGRASRPDSGSESACNKTTGRKSGDETKALPNPAIDTPLPKAPPIQSKKSMTNLPTKSKLGGEGSSKSMTVETETVSSVPQVALGGGTGERVLSGRNDTGGSVRTKPSVETIRPKKEKKKTTRKAPSINSGTASSKADIFEAKVASAVDEANSSDSEETFVYESNPPEPLSARPHRFHSRTPSVASVVSQLDHHGTKNRPDGHHSIVGKKSMKFANNYNSVGYQNESERTVRGSGQNGHGSSTPHHHPAGRNGRGAHTSLFDSDSPFANAARSAKSAPSHITHFPNRHTSPRADHLLRFPRSPRKAEGSMSYDLEGEGADDERAPLIGSTRSGRNRRRPLPGSVRQIYSTEDKTYRCCGKATTLISLASILAILIGIFVFMIVLCTKPLLDVHVKAIRNVLASEQEIMLDLQVSAINPNLIAIQVSDLDVNIFAKSKHVGTTSLWRSDGTHGHTSASLLTTKNMRRSPRGSRMWRPSDIISHLGGVDEGNDPIDDDPATDAQTMLLGQIFEFDTPLIFDPSPLRWYILPSVGEVRLAKPGNHTEEGGSQRWEQVLQHDFELIVRGVMRYSSPVSSRTRSASIAGSVVVHPNAASKSGSMGISKPSTMYDPGSNVILSPPSG